MPGRLRRHLAADQVGGLRLGAVGGGAAGAPGPSPAWACCGCCSRCSAAGRWCWCCSTGYLAYVFTLPAGLWWAAGINQLPLQIALVFGLHAHLAYLRTGRLRHLVAALAWTTAGLLFYEKTLLLFGVYAIVALGWFCTGATPRAAAQLWYALPAPGSSPTRCSPSATWRSTSPCGLDFSPGNSGDQPWAPIAWNLVAGRAACRRWSADP